jgi:mono/diheme cytochrome c family protein
MHYGEGAHLLRRVAGVVLSGILLAIGFAAWATGLLPSKANEVVPAPNHASDAAQSRLARGQETFRHDTFGDEQQWTDTLRMHEVIESGLDPITALSLGLKVDADALPDDVLLALFAGEVNLADPQTTLLLLELDAVAGVKGTVEHADGKLKLTSVGITCALCHSTVDDSLAPGIGRRLDGWANVDLDPGAIIAASPAVPEAAKAVYRSWGPGKYDPRFSIDGLSTPIVIPPAYGLAGVAKETFTGDGEVSYWNNYVAVTQMGGQGVFVDPRLGIKVVRTPDRVHGKLQALVDYELTLPTPTPPAGSYDPALAAAGEIVFDTVGHCADCHFGPHFTDVNEGVLHDPAEVGQDPAYAARTVTGQYRTTPLRGLWQHPPYFHDGSAETLEDVVEHYDGHFDLQLTDEEKSALVEFLKTL